jgi:hypothetical protein
MYSGQGHRPRRLDLRYPRPNCYSVRWQTTGFYVVEGSDPTGRPYAWRGAHPCDLGSEGLSKPTPEMVDKFFTAAAELLVRHRRIGDP